MQNFWKILEIAPTTDLRTIKQAYAKQSQRYHPEEDPEGFQALQAAYQKALAWRKRQVAKQANSETLTNQDHLETSSLKTLDLSTQAPPRIIQELDIDDLRASSQTNQAYQNGVPIEVADLQEAQPKELFRTGVSNTYQEGQSFLAQVQAETANGLTLEHFRLLLQRAAILQLLPDPEFEVALSDIISHQLTQTEPKIIRQMAKMSADMKANELAKYLKKAAFNYQFNQSHQANQNKNNWRYTINISIGIVSLILATSLVLTKLSGPSEATPPNYSHNASLTQLLDKQNMAKIEKMMDDLKLELSETVYIQYDREKGVYVIHNSADQSQVELTGYTSVYLFNVDENGMRSKGLVASKDEVTWELLTETGRSRGKLEALEAAVTDYNLIVIENGKLTATKELPSETSSS